MFATFHTPADLTFQGFSPKTIGTRFLAALLAAEARAKARRDYRRMLGSDELLRDVGVSREEVRRAMADMN
jgi:uncharacterized protein YjiS (DUF1127 family)